MSSPEQEEDEKSDDDEPTSPSSDQGKYSPTNEEESPLTPHPPAVPLLLSEANALGRSLTDNPFLQNRPIPETEDLILTVPRSVKSESWIGEWNVEMDEVRRALRELR
jgi:hypothetical protein